MRKRSFPLLIVIAIMLPTILFSMPVSAAELSTYSDFEDYSGKWDGVENFSCVLPKFSNISRTKCSPSTLNEYSGITNGTAADNKYGNSLKIVQKPNSASESNVNTMVHFDEEMTGSVYLEVSMYVEKSATGKYSGKAIRMNCDKGLIYPVTFNESQKIDIFGAGTGVTWLPDEWYDVKAWYNLDSGAYKVQISNDGNSVVDTFGITTAGEKMNRFIFYMVHHCKHESLIAAGEQVTYFDNFKFESTDKVIVDEMASLTHYTFDEWDDANGLPATLGKGTWKKGLGGSGTHPVEQIKTDRGYSAKICANETDDISQFSGSARQDITNPALFMNFGINISTAAAMKVSFMFPDDNFTNIQIKMSNNIIALQALSNASITAFDGRDTGLDVKLNTWYDLEIVLDYDTGYYNYYLTDGTFEYKDAGFSKETIAQTETRLYRTWFRINDRMENKYAEPSAFIIDDFYYGPISKLSAPLYGGSNLTDAEKVSLELPFKNTKFRYNADVTVSDIAKDTVLAANGTRVISKVTTEFNYDLVKFGSDGKIYIGSAEVAEASTGTYSVEAIVNQTDFSAAVTVLKDGAVIGSGVVALGDAEILMKKINWTIVEDAAKVGAVEYRGIYAFELDNVNSSKGIIKASEPVVARFTNALDKASFNSTTVTVNDDEITPEISFVDDNTVKFDFAKAPGSTYTVKFNGVSDLFGNTVSDYIRVTMDEDGGIYLTDVEFTKNGEVVDVTQPGTITATVSAAAYGGDENVNYTLALYESGRMVDCDFVSFTASKTLEDHSLEVTVPDDGKHYVAKTYVQNSETLEAYSEPEVLKATNKPVVILKLDGIGVGNRYNAFKPAYDYAVENNIKMNFGILARDLDSTNTADIEKLDEMENHEMIEFWNHQYGSGNMRGYTREEIFADFENAKVASEKTGVEYVTFNSIENYIHSDIVDALNAYNYKAVLSRASEDRLGYYGYLDKDNTFTTLWRTFDVEAGKSGILEDGSSKSGATVCLPVEDMIDDWTTAQFQKWPYVVLQYHPVNWPASDLTTSDGKVYSSDYMYDFIEYLEADGVIFMTSTEYIDYSSILN